MELEEDANAGVADDAPEPAPQAGAPAEAEKRELERKERGARVKRKVAKQREEARRGGKGGFLRRLFGGRPGPTMHGKVVLNADGKIVIEIAVDQPVRWDPAPALAVYHGLQRSPTVDVAASTRAGRYGPGQTIRLVLREDELPEALRVGDIEVLLD